MSQPSGSLLMQRSLTVNIILCRIMYDRSTDFWQMLFHIASGLGSPSKHFWSQFFGAQMRFYRQMLMASKVSHSAAIF